MARVCALRGNPDEDFYYLGGPMTGIPQFNYPRFNEVACRLRNMGYNIVSPSELDDSETEASALASADGVPGSKDGAWHDFLARDVVICAMPTCVGGIFLEGWERSSGAALETFVLDRLKKPLYAYSDTENAPMLTQFDRDTALEPPPTRFSGGSFDYHLLNASNAGHRWLAIPHGTPVRHITTPMPKSRERPRSRAVADPTVVERAARRV